MSVIFIQKILLLAVRDRIDNANEFNYGLTYMRWFDWKFLDKERPMAVAICEQVEIFSAQKSKGYIYFVQSNKP